MEESPSSVESIETTKRALMGANTWKPFLAFAFMIVIIFDFVIAPVYFGFARMGMEKLIPLIQTMEPSVQQQIITANSQVWKPLTMSDGVGMFYLCIGAILTGVAIAGPGGRGVK